MKNVIYAAVMTLISLPAHAEGLYAGVGYSNVTAHESGYTWTSLNVIGLAGYEFNEYISVEGEGSFVIKEGTLEGVGVGNSHTGAFVKLALPMEGPFTPHARFGYVKGKATVSAGGISVTIDDDAPVYGIGAEYDLGGTSLRADYSVADFGRTDTGVLSLTTVVKF